ncbi:MAG: sigma 54-interacting transcriptional regulator [Myxococcales bacterium]|nr:sigma 54-interacting transcriptional regulator [Myxococcales bacterium]MDD9971160.1 sigma 54-interacting transcriptional regulator [Myxococcales bacterium]
MDTWRAATTRDEAEGEVGTPCLTILWHPDLRRVGQRLLLTQVASGRPQCFARGEGLFCHPQLANRLLDGAAEPLCDPYVSRTAATLRCVSSAGTMALQCGKVVTHVDGHPPSESAIRFERQTLSRGVLLRVSRRTLLLLHLRREPPADSIPTIVGDCDAIRDLRTRIIRLAGSDDPVLVEGETGTGKELIASALHACSHRRAGPMVAVNMAVLGESMAPSELFGHVRGAFTGAERSRRGVFERAHGGVLFLDEILDTPASVQPMLLRVLETRRIVPVGAEREMPVDVRLVSASDRPLEEAVLASAFRAPLFHRLAAQYLRVPPLRERRDDIPRLFVHFVAEALGDADFHRKSQGDPGPRGALGCSAAWMEQLVRAPLPGNARELRSIARTVCRGERTERLGGPERTNADGKRVLDAKGEPSEASQSAPGGPNQEAIVSALEDNDFVVDRAAKQLGIASSSLHYLMQGCAIRRAKDIPSAEIVHAMSQAGGDLVVAARALRVSRRALGMTMRERRMDPGPLSGDPK